MRPVIPSTPVNEEEDASGSSTFGRHLSRKESQATIPKKYQSMNLPRLGTNIDDIREKVNIHEFGKRFLLVGLNYECHSFTKLRDLIDHLKKEMKPKEKVKDYLKNAACPIWIDIQNPSKKDLKEMEFYFGFHPLTTEDIMDTDANEKCELFYDYMFIVLTGQVDEELPIPMEITNRLKKSQTNILETQLNIVLFKNYVLTIHDYPICGFDSLLRRIAVEQEIEPSQPKSEIEQLISDYEIQRVTKSHAGPHPIMEHTHGQVSIGIEKLNERSRIKGKKSVKYTIIPSSDWILYAFLDAMVDIYIPFVNSIFFEVDIIDELIHELRKTEHEELLKRLGITKKTTVSLERLLLPKRKISLDLIHQHNDFICKNVQYYLRDVIDHLEICLEKLEAARENLIHAHHNYLTKVQMEIVEASGRTDEFMERLSVIVLLFAPPNLIASLFGMNVRVPFQWDTHPNVYPFFGIVTAMIIFFFLTIILLRKQFV